MSTEQQHNLTALFIDNNRHTYNIQLIRVEQTYKRMGVDTLALEFLEKTDTSLPYQSCNSHITGMLLAMDCIVTDGGLTL